MLNDLHLLNTKGSRLSSEANQISHDRWAGGYEEMPDDLDLPTRLHLDCPREASQRRHDRRERLSNIVTLEALR